MAAAGFNVLSEWTDQTGDYAQDAILLVGSIYGAMIVAAHAEFAREQQTGAAGAPELLGVLRKILNSVPFSHSHQALQREAEALLARLDCVA